MAYDLFRGHHPKNFAIQGHPPLHSHEYVMAGGGYYAPPARPWRPRPAPTPSGISGSGAAPALPYEVSSTDWEASQRWVGNLAENVRAVRREMKDKILSADEVEKFANFWRRWLVFGSRVGSGLEPMSPAARREWKQLLAEGWQLYERFRLLGLNRVAPPYLGELAVVLATMPDEETLPNMSARLLDAARASERLLDQRAPWWAWRKVPSDPRPLAQGVVAARELARGISEVARTSPGVGTRDRGAPVYAKVAAVIAELYRAASALYGGEEKSSRPGADEGAPGEPGAPRTSLASLGWLLAVGAAGYLGARWLTGGKKEHVAGNDTLGYYPGVNESGDEEPEEG
jgi:hypothetical protein